MSFYKHLQDYSVIIEHNEPGESNEILPLTESQSTPEDILKTNKIKIRSKIQTDFGTQYEFFTKFGGKTKEIIDDLFPTNDVLFKGNFIFVIS